MNNKYERLDFIEDGSIRKWAVGKVFRDTFGLKFLVPDQNVAHHLDGYIIIVGTGNILHHSSIIYPVESKS